MGRQEKRGAGQILLRLGFLVYAAAMLWLLFGQRLGTRVYEQQLADSVNLTLFATIRMFLRILQNSDDPYLLRHAVINLAGNVVMFIPLGFFLPYLTEKLRGFFKTLLAATVLILLVEAVQYVTLLGSCDVDDLLLNLVGVILGYVLWRVRRQ